MFIQIYRFGKNCGSVGAEVDLKRIMTKKDTPAFRLFKFGVYGNTHQNMYLFTEKLNYSLRVSIEIEAIIKTLFKTKYLKTGSAIRFFYRKEKPIPATLRLGWRVSLLCTSFFFIIMQCLQRIHFKREALYIQFRFNTSR